MQPKTLFIHKIFLHLSKKAKRRQQQQLKSELYFAPLSKTMAKKSRKRKKHKYSSFLYTSKKHTQHTQWHGFLEIATYCDEIMQMNISLIFHFLLSLSLSLQCATFIKYWKRKWWCVIARRHHIWQQKHVI